jgi:hypothetical protein
LINISRLLLLIKELYSENESVKLVCNILLAVLVVSSLLSSIALINAFATNAGKARSASTHYNKWFEQLPPEHPMKQEMKELQLLREYVSTLGLVSGALFDIQEEMIKYELGKLDFSEVGVLENYLSKKLDQAKPVYALVDVELSEVVQRIKIKAGTSKSIKLYRNGEELFFEYVSPENWLNAGGIPDLHQILSSGFVKAYSQDTDIVIIENNVIKAISKGQTKLIFVYGTQLLECKVKVY